MGKIINIEQYRTQGVAGMKKVTINAYEDFINDPNMYGTGYGKGEIQIIQADSHACSLEWDESKEDGIVSPYNDPYDFLVEVLEALGYEVDIKVEYETEE